MNKKINIELLQKYIAKECSIEEQKEVIQWFIDDVYDDSLKWAFMEDWNKKDIKEHDLSLINIDPIIDRVHREINLRKYKYEKSLVQKTISLVTKVAAVLFLPLIIGIGWYYLSNVSNSDKVQYAEIIAPRGSISNFELPDGSTVWLNSGSKLKYPVKFGKKNRQVALNGEGYFSVKKDTDKPFIVNAGKIYIEVLGTMFDVKSYENDDNTYVTLEKGKVKVDYEQKTLAYLHPGEQISISQNGSQFNVSGVDATLFSIWREGKIIFKDESFKNILNTFERMYNVDFEIGDKEILEYKYYAVFENESIDEVLKLIQITSPLKFEKLKREQLPDGSYARQKIIINLK